MSTRKQEDYLGMALYCRIVIDALLDFLRDIEVKELKEKMRSAADLIVWLGAELVPEFKTTVRRWEKGKKYPSYGYGSMESRLHYEHYLIFEKAVKRGSHQGQLAEIRKGLLSIIRPSTKLKVKKEAVNICLDFFVGLESACLYAFHQEYFNR